MKTHKVLPIIALISISFVQIAVAKKNTDDLCKDRQVPQLINILDKTGIKFTHTYSPEKKYIVESMSGGVLLIDYDRDGFPDIYFTNAPTVDMALNKQPAKSSLYHNNGDGTFTDVSKQLGMDDPQGFYGMQPVAADFGNSGRQDVYIANDSTPNFFYQNEGKGKFKEIGLISGTGVSGDGSEQGSMGVAVCDYLHTGNFAIYVTNFVDENNTLYRNNGNYDFTDVSFNAKV